jgi:hypothetical protein
VETSAIAADMVVAIGTIVSFTGYRRDVSLSPDDACDAVRDVRGDLRHGHYVGSRVDGTSLVLVVGHDAHHRVLAGGGWLVGPDRQVWMSSGKSRVGFNPPPNWPPPPQGWTPHAGWQSDPSWGPAPVGWPVWVRQTSRWDTAKTMGGLAAFGVLAVALWLWIKSMSPIGGFVFILSGFMLAAALSLLTCLALIVRALLPHRNRGRRRECGHHMVEPGEPFGAPSAD